MFIISRLCTKSHHIKHNKVFLSILLSSLNDKQREAVTTTQGPLLVIAGAGSGKTRALTHRIAYMIQEKGVNPWNILAVTFTNKAANEMKKRIVSLLSAPNQNASQSNPADSLPWENQTGAMPPEQSTPPPEKFNPFTPDPNMPHVGTFHSICVRILRKTIHLLNYENSFVIYDTADQQILLKHIMEELDLDPKQLNPKAILSQISNAKNQLIEADKYHSYVHNFFTEKVAEIYKRYQSSLQKNNALDFDDIIMKTVKIFQTQPQILDQYQEKFKYISVDEYQDTNHAQYILTNLLAKKYRNICVIGDGDQSIYSFRGANIGNILNFEKDYPEAKSVLLEQNYRSTQNILDAAHSIIIKNAKRKEKKLWTEQKGGEKIKLRALENEREEAYFVAKQIQAGLRGHEYQDYTNFVVLYRTNAQSRVVEESFLRYGIPYKIIGGIKFYQRKEVKDIVSYLRVIQNPNDSVSLLRIINTPSRKIGSKTLETLQHYAIQKDISLFQAMIATENANGDAADIAASKSEAIQKFVKMIQELQKVNHEFSASGLIKHVLDYTGYKAFINDGTLEGETRLENIYELISVASKYDSLEAGMSLSIFLEEIALIADVDGLNDQDNAVTLMTIHSAKGLEYPTVFLIGLEEGILPHSRSLLERDELEEERRLMYVAITRAKENLYLLRAKSRMLYGETKSGIASQFLDDIPAEIVEADEREKKAMGRAPGRLGNLSGTTLTSTDLHYTPIPVEEFDEFAQETAELTPGDKVSHESFGEGTVVSVTGGIAQVRFKNPRYGLKKLALSIAPLKKL